MSLQSSQHSESPKARAAAIWLLGSLIALCFIIVTLGGYVRLSGSGLAIPEWPFFTVSQTLDESGKVIASQKSIFPPTTPEGWEVLKAIFVRDIPGFEAGIAMNEFKRMFYIEWGHRAVAKFIGVVYLALMVVTYYAAPIRKQIGGLVASGFVLLILQATLGGIAVWLHLDPVKVSLHLVNAFFFTSVLVWALLKLAHPSSLPKATWNPVVTTAWAVYAICTIQLFSGGLMAGSHAGYTMNTWPRMGDQWVAPGVWDAEGSGYYNFTQNIVFIQFFHRWFAFVVVGAVVYLALRTAYVEVSKVGRWALRVAPAIVVLQVILGIFTLLKGVHTHLALTHQSVGLVLLLSVLVVAYEATFHPVLLEDALAERDEKAKAASREPAHA